MVRKPEYKPQTRAGDALDDWLRLTNVRVDDLAEKVGVSRDTMYRWISGYYCPTVVQAKKIERITGVPINAWAEKPTKRK